MILVFVRGVGRRQSFSYIHRHYNGVNRRQPYMRVFTRVMPVSRNRERARVDEGNPFSGITNGHSRVHALKLFHPRPLEFYVCADLYVKSRARYQLHLGRRRLVHMWVRSGGDHGAYAYVLSADLRGKSRHGKNGRYDVKFLRALRSRESPPREQHCRYEYYSFSDHASPDDLKIEISSAYQFYPNTR